MVQAFLETKVAEVVKQSSLRRGPEFLIKGRHLDTSHRGELQPAEQLWRFATEPLANRCFATIESIDDAVGQRCLTLTHQCDIIRDSTIFHWWPHQPLIAPHRSSNGVGAIPIRSRSDSQMIRASRMKCTRQRCQVALSALTTAALGPHGHPR
jgi:hypothetical protein